MINATVGPKVLARAMDLFDQTPRTIFSELLQNARRANARNVAVTVQNLGEIDGKHHCRVTVADDGDGVADPATLVSFGGSNWNLELDRSENAAGMGFFALATNGANVRSANWEVNFPPAGFAGREAMPVYDRAHIVGTRVRFSITSAVDDVLSAINSEVLYYPVPVLINEIVAEQRAFLAGAMAITDALGVKIGVYRDNQRLFYGVYPARIHPGPILNFHGRTVIAPARCGIPTVVELTDGAHDDLRTVWSAKIDLVHAPGVKLVLPSRHAIIENDEWKTIVCRRRARNLRANCRTAGPSIAVRVVCSCPSDRRTVDASACFAAAWLVDFSARQRDELGRCAAGLYDV